MDSVAIDWDDTLTFRSSPGGLPGEWTPGAVEAVRSLFGHGLAVTVLTCRANWAEGRQEVEGKLGSVGLWPHPHVSVAGKPLAVAYVDDRAVPFRGDWAGVVHDVLEQRARRAKRKAKA